MNEEEEETHAQLMQKHTDKLSRAEQNEAMQDVQNNSQKLLMDKSDQPNEKEQVNVMKDVVEDVHENSKELNKDPILSNKTDENKDTDNMNDDTGTISTNDNTVLDKFAEVEDEEDVMAARKAVEEEKEELADFNEEQTIEKGEDQKESFDNTLEKKLTPVMKYAFH